MPTKPLSNIKDKVGDSYTVIEDFKVEEGKVAEFAHAIKDENPRYIPSNNESDGTRKKIPAPLTFTRTAYFPRYRPDHINHIRPFDLGFRSEYSIHGNQEYEFERPVYVGDVLTGVIELVDVYQREGTRGGNMTFAIFEIRYTDRTGAPVLTERQTIIETEGPISGGGQK